MPGRHRCGVFAGCGAALLLVAGCQSQGGPGVTMGSPDPTSAHAAATRVDVYGAGATCSGSGVAAGSGAPVTSRTFARGEVVALDLQPGAVVVLFQAFGDVAMTEVIGSACS